LGSVPEWKKRWCMQRLGEEGVKKVRELYERGVPIKEIMAELGLSTPDCVYAFVEVRRRGSYRRRTRISEEMRRAVVQMRREGKSILEIARTLGISVGSVHRILREWKETK
jgi:hypothetical protein